MREEGDGCLMILYAVFGCVAIGVVALKGGFEHAHDEFRECRALLATDSAAVLRYRTECAKWTLPPREAR